MKTTHTAWDNIRGITRVSMCDWPGRISCVLFTGGCNLLCPTCHNGGLAWRPDAYPVTPREEVLGYLKARRRWLEGVTITGGEPTLTEGLPELLTDIKELGFAVKMDTNGLRPDVVAELLSAGLVDVFAVDVKAPFAKYPEVTGRAVTSETAEEFLGHIFDLAALRPEAFYFRTTMVPALTELDMNEVRAIVPDGAVHVEQPFVEPGRHYAEANTEAGRLSGDMVA